MFASAVAARDQNGIGATFSYGSKSCGAMTDDVKKTIDGENVYIAYVEGYLTAINVLSLGKANFFDGTESISRFKFVLKYCEDNPLDLVIAAINKLVLRYKESLY